MSGPRVLASRVVHRSGAIRIVNARRALAELVAAAQENHELAQGLAERVGLLERRLGEFAHKVSSASPPRGATP